MRRRKEGGGETQGKERRGEREGDEPAYIIVWQACC